MKVLVFHLGAERFGLPLAQIERVLPAMALRAVPLAPPWLAGLMDLHGAPVPVIDLACLAGVALAPPCFDTRILLVGYRDDAARPQQLGLLAEHVLGIGDIDCAGLTESGVSGAPMLGRIGSDGGAMLQLVDLDGLLPAAVRAQLFQAGRVSA